MEASPEITKEQARAKQIVFRLLKIRNRSEKEIKDRLKLKRISEDTIEKTLCYFKEAQSIDDRAFAQWWIHARLAKPLGLKRIQFELKQKGISDEILNEVIPEVFNRQSEFPVVEELARKRWQNYKNLDTLTKKRRLSGYLARRGFSSESIQQVLRKL